ncbi:MAG: TRAP transporter large permease subunit, partial [Desulfobulbia bacterium]
LLMDPSANITAVWLGVMIGLNIQTSFLTPPFGFALFYLRGVAPAAVKTVEMYKGVIPFISLQILALVIVGSWPSLVNYLPNRISLLSETAPPPLNPRLQYCIEENLFKEFAANEKSLRDAISKIRTIDISYLPKNNQSDLKGGLDKAEAVFENVDKVKSTRKAMDAGAVEYRPVHKNVRRIQKNINKIKTELQETRDQINRIKRSPDADQSRIKTLDAHISELEAEKKELEVSIPTDWDDVNKKFGVLLKAHNNARRQYQRGSDGAYEPVQELIRVIEALPALQKFQSELQQITQMISPDKLDEVSKKINDLSKRLRKIPGTRALTSKLSSARRYTRGRRKDLDKAKENMEQAEKILANDLAWRKRASEDMLEELKTYELSIRNNIGLRHQDRLPRDKALEVASCNSVHQDLSLSF